MNLYRVFFTGHIGYDEYDSAVVCTTSKEKALKMSPDFNDMRGEKRFNYTWDGAEYIGKATRGKKEGVITASFNAG